MNIKNLRNGTKLLKDEKTNEKFLAFKKDDIDYEKMLISQLKKNEFYDQLPINFKLLIEQRLSLFVDFNAEQ